MKKFIILLIVLPNILGDFIIYNKVYTDEQIVNAIYKAEGGKKAVYKYGIRSIKYKTEAEARKICLNTIKNNRKRYLKYGYKRYRTFLEFLASRYAPINCENDNGNNRYWLNNVKYFLNRS